jgi:hypothetical protein
MHRLALAVALALAANAPAWAETPQHQEGVYTGAKPGVRPGADEGKPQSKPRAKTLSWIGFEAKDGGATVWLQAASSFDVAQRMDGSTLVVTVTGLSKMVRNTRRPIDTRFFENPLSRISAKVRKKKVELRIAFKNAKDAREAQTRTATEADGLNYVYLSFPPGEGSSENVDETATGPATSP